MISINETVTNHTDFNTVGRISYLMQLQKQVMSLDFSSDVIKALLEYKRPNIVPSPSTIYDEHKYESPELSNTFGCSVYSQIINSLSLICGIQKSDEPVGHVYRCEMTRDIYIPMAFSFNVNSYTYQLRAAAYSDLSRIITDIITEIEQHSTPLIYQQEYRGHRRREGIHRIIDEVAKTSRRGRANNILVNHQFMIDCEIQIPTTNMIHEFTLEGYPGIKFLYHRAVKNYATAFYHGCNNFDRAPQLVLHENYTKEKFINPNTFEPFLRYIVRYHLDINRVSDYFFSII